MVKVRVSATSAEVMAESPELVSVNRQSAEVVADQSPTGDLVRVSAVAVEVMAASPKRPSINRQSVEVAIDQDPTGDVVRVSAVAVEAMSAVPRTVTTNRQSAEVVADQSPTGDVVRVSAVALEVMALTSVPQPVPLPLPDNLEVFAHNWADEVTMETSYETDISRSRETGAEERRSLMERPQRVITVRWLQREREVIDRLLVNLRRLTGENMILPLYQDMSLLTQDSSGTTLWVDASTRRYFNGGRVLVAPVRNDGQFYLNTDVQVLSISNALPDRLLLTGSLTGTLLAGQWFAAPMIDLEIVLEPTVKMRTVCVGDLSLEAREFKGQSSLPPVASGLPTGWNVQLGLPVFEIAPDETAGVDAVYKRYGQLQRHGRKQQVFVEGTRYNQLQNYDLILDRQDFWSVLSFFDSRKGRLSSFWAVDREFIWTVLLTSTTFIDVQPLGVFDDFNDIWTDQNIAAGIVMTDGTCYVVQINTVQDLGGTWRLTLAGGQTLPSINVTQIQRFARARLTRFETDEITERWASTSACRMRVSTIETQQEKTIDVENP